MNEEEFNRNRLRFGDDVNSWPPPYRLQASSAFSDLVDAGGAEHSAFDRLIMDAAGLETDEQALARNVMRRLRQERSTGYSSSVLHFLLKPAGLAACTVAILTIFTVSGYQMARFQDDALDSAMLALATGAPLSEDLTADPITGGEPL